MDNESVNNCFWATLNDQVSLHDILGTSLPWEEKDRLLTLNKGSWYS